MFQDSRTNDDEGIETDTPLTSTTETTPLITTTTTADESMEVDS